MSLTCETYRKREGFSEITGGYWMYEIIKTEDNPRGERLDIPNISKIR